MSMSEILTLNKYIQKIREMIPREKIDYRQEDYERAYAEYRRLKGKRAPETHKVDLSKEPYFIITQNVKGFFSQCWIILSDLNKYLLKELPDAKFYKNRTDFFSRANARVVPKIVRATGLKSAEYYIANWVMDDSVSTWEDDFLLTPSFLKDGDEMLNFKDILGQDCMDIDVLEKRLRKELELRRFKTKDIAKFIQELRKEICMSEILDNSDMSSENMSVIFNNNSVRIAPMYDYDFCMGNESTANRHFKIRGMEGLHAVLSYYKDDVELMKWLREKVLTIDFEKMIANEFESEDALKLRQRYIDFWERQMQIVKEYAELNQDKEHE